MSKRFKVIVETTVELEIEQKLFDVVADKDWQKHFYTFPTEEDVAAFVGYNVAQAGTLAFELSGLDGFANLSDDLVKVRGLDTETGDAEAVEAGS